MSTKNQPENNRFSGLAFDGQNDLVEIPDSPSLTVTKQWSLAARIKWDGGGAPYQAILSQPTLATNTGIALVVKENGAVATSLNTTKPLTNALAQSAPGAIVPGEWTTVAATYDGAHMKIYKDGKELGHQNCPRRTVDVSAQSFFIGVEGPGHPLNERLFRGTIAEAAFWNYARPQKTISGATLVGYDDDKAGLLAHYEFEDGPNSTTLTDQSKNGNTGNIHGASWMPVLFSGKLTIEWQAIEGGFWSLVGSYGESFVPHKLPEQFQVQDIEVQCVLEAPPTKKSRGRHMSTRMWGTDVVVVRIKEDHAAGQSPEDQADKFHQFVAENEFLLSFSDLVQSPVQFAVEGALITSSAGGQPDLFRLIAVDPKDHTKGYRLFSGGRYASKQETLYGNSDCVGVTGSPDAALIFVPKFLSATQFELTAPAFQRSDPKAPRMHPATLSRRYSGGAETLMLSPGVGGFQQVMNIPTEGRLILEQISEMKKWHGFFSRAQFPLTFADRDHVSLQLSGTHIIPGSAALFQLEAVDPGNFEKGYRLQTDGHYVSRENSYGSYICVSADTDPSKAKVFVPVFSGMQFSLKDIASGKVLSRPWDNYNGKLSGRRVVDFSARGRGVFAATQQMFEMPMWPIRQSKMSYISTDLHFNLALGDNVLTVQGDNLILGVADDANSEAMLTATHPSSAHAGYILSVGGKYLKMTGADTPVTLTDDAKQATHLCPIFDGQGRISFWHGTSDHVLSVKDNQPVFTLLQDPSKTSPTWAMQAPDHSRSMHTLSVEADATTSLGDTIHLKPIVEKLNQTSFAKKRTVWDYSFDNALPQDWLLSTPDNKFGRYQDFKFPVYDTGANDFNLQTCDPTVSNDPNHPCVQLDSSVDRPGGVPGHYHAGHSCNIYEEMYRLIISADGFVDITSLLRKHETPSGEFLAAIRNAITYLSHKPSAENVKIRLLFGEPLGWLGDTGRISGTGPYKSAPDVLNELVRDIPMPTSSKIEVYVAYTSSVKAITWNHSKIIAVDGKRALVGGHNMWSGPYLNQNPVFDVSMKLSGSAALDAHHFADNLWFEQVQAHEDYWLEDAASFTDGGAIGAGTNAVPATRLFEAFKREGPHDPPRMSGKGIPVLSVGRTEGAIAETAPSDIAIVALLDSAKSNIYISAQALSHAPLYPRNWPEQFLDALARAVVRGVNVFIYMSDPKSGSYQGDPPGDVIEKIQSRDSFRGKSNAQIKALMNRLTVRSFPNSSKWSLENEPGISNHAKVILVDKRTFSIGSQNYYPSSPATMSEFTYMVESAPNGEQLYNDYFAKMEAWANPEPATSTINTNAKRYAIKLVSLKCILISGGGIISGLDDCYLKLGEKIWPAEKSYEKLNTGDIVALKQVHTIDWWKGVKSVSATTPLPVLSKFDDEMTVGLYEWDVFSDDHLADFKFHPNGVYIRDSRTGISTIRKMSDLQPNTIYGNSGTMKDSKAVYQLNFEFSKE